MRVTKSHKSGRAVALCLAATLAVPPASAAAAPAAPGTVVAAAVGVTSTRLTQVADVSKDGRYALGLFAGRWVVRDVVRGRTVRRLPSSAAYTYHAISDSGRYVAYSYTKASRPQACNTPWVRDRITNKARSAATTKTGGPLPTGWAGAGECPDEPSWRSQFTFSDPAISGNGRYVAFCANLTVADRLDLYVKNLRSKRITKFDGVCSERTDAFEQPQTPQISQTGRVILLPGRHATGDEAGYDVWQPASLLLNRSILVHDVGGALPRMTDDGSSVYSTGPLTCDGGWDPCSAGPKAPIRYDVASGTIAALPAGDPGAGPMSRRGRYVLVVTTDAAGNQLTVLDRATGTSTDLTASFAAAGVAIPSNTAWTRLSGDGRVVLLAPDSGGIWYRLRWM